MSDLLSRSDIAFMQSIADDGNREFTMEECGGNRLNKLKALNFVVPVYYGDIFPSKYRLTQDALDFLLDRAEEKQRFEALERREREHEEKQEKLHRQENRRSWIQFWITTGIASAALIVSIIALMKSQ